MPTLTEDILLELKKRQAMESAGVRAIEIGGERLGGKPYSYILFDGLTDKNFHTDNGFTREELQGIATELDHAIKKILASRLAKTLDEIHTLSTPL